MHDLSAFREAAAAMRSREGFSGAFINFNGERGEWTTGSGHKKMIINGHRLVVGVSLMLAGWQKFVGNKPFYDSVGFIRDRHQPRPREELGDHDKNRWRDGADPWKLTYFLPAHDTETRQHFMFVTSSGGGKDALAALQAIFVEHNEARPDQVPQWPMVELSADSYTNNFDKKIFVPIFDIIDWLDPPLSFQAVTPPPNTVAKIEHKPDPFEAADHDQPPFDDDIPPWK